MNKEALYTTIAIHVLLGFPLYVWSNGDEFLVLYGAVIVFETILTVLSLLIRRLTKIELAYFLLHVIIGIIIIPILYVIAINASGWSGLGYMLIALVLVMTIILNIPTYFVFRKTKRP